MTLVNGAYRLRSRTQSARIGLLVSGLALGVFAPGLALASPAERPYAEDSGRGSLARIFALFADAATRPASTISERQAQQALFDQDLRAFSLQTFESFAKGATLPLLDARGLESTAVPEWLLNEFRVRLESSVTQTFFRQTLLRLRATGAPTSLRFVAETERLFGSFYLAGFRIFSEFGGKASEQGRFSPGTGEVWIALRNLTFADWNVVFVHELAHAIDPVLRDAERSLSLRSEWWRLYWSTRGKTSLGELSPDETEQLKQFARALLDRGLLAEVRAWRETIALLAEAAAHEPAGLRDLRLPDPFTNVGPWLARSQSAADLEKSVFESLRPRFTLPAAGTQLDSRVLAQALQSVLDEHALCLTEAVGPSAAPGSC